MKAFVNALVVLFVVLQLGLTPTNSQAGQSRTQNERINDCDDVIERSVNAATPEQALSVLGACLATPAPLPVLQRVALQMAIVSFQSGDSEWGMRYLVILQQMMESDGAADAIAQ